MTAGMPRIGNMDSFALVSPAFGIPEGCIVRNTFIERPDFSAEGSPRSARSCPEEALSSFGVCGIETAPSESEGSTRSPATDEEAEIDGSVGPKTAPPVFSSLSATAAAWEVPTWQWWSDMPDESFYQSAWPPSQQDMWDVMSQPPTLADTPRTENSKSASDPTSLVLRGLPFTTSESEIKLFLERAGVGSKDVLKEVGIVLLSNPQGRATGFAEIHLAHGAHFAHVREKIHMQQLGGRYIEVLPPRQARKRAGGSASRRASRRRS